MCWSLVNFVLILLKNYQKSLVQKMVKLRHFSLSYLNLNVLFEFAWLRLTSLNWRQKPVVTQIPGTSEYRTFWGLILSIYSDISWWRYLRQIHLLWLRWINSTNCKELTWKLDMIWLSATLIRPSVFWKKILTIWILDKSDIQMVKTCPVVKWWSENVTIVSVLVVGLII